MISKKKFLSAILAISIVAALAIGGTIAYLTDQTDTVTNTFTVGNVDITLDESKLKDDGTLDTARTQENSYKLMPGTTYPKDPIIKVVEDSEDCWVFAEITDASAAQYVTYQMAGAWEPIADGSNVYYCTTALSEGDSVELLADNQVTIKNDVGSEDNPMPAGDVALAFKAYAVQKDNFDTAVAAWNATFGASATGDSGSGDSGTNP